MMTITVNEIETTITNYINLGTEILTYISETDEMLKHYTLTDYRLSNKKNRINLTLECKSNNFYPKNDKILMSIETDKFLKWLDTRNINADTIINAINNLRKDSIIALTIRGETLDYKLDRHKNGGWDLKCLTNVDNIETWYGINCITLTDVRTVLIKDYMRGVITKAEIK